jgi:hypothetical protein
MTPCAPTALAARARERPIRGGQRRGLDRSCTTRRAGIGLPPAISAPDARCTRRRCCATAACLPPGDLMAVPTIPRARNCTKASHRRRQPPLQRLLPHQHRRQPPHLAFRLGLLRHQGRARRRYLAQLRCGKRTRRVSNYSLLRPTNPQLSRNCYFVVN